MAFNITIIGEDTLDDYAKVNFEKQLMDATNLFVEQIKKLSGVTLTTATAEADSQELVSFIPAPEKAEGKAKAAKDA